MKKLKNLQLGKELSRGEMKNLNGGGRPLCECMPGKCYCFPPNSNVGILCGDPRLCQIGNE